MKFDSEEFCENLSRKSIFADNRTKISGSLHEDEYVLLLPATLNRHDSDDFEAKIDVGSEACRLEIHNLVSTVI